MMKKTMCVTWLMTFGLLLSAGVPAAAQVLRGGSSWALTLYTQQDEYAVKRQGGSVTLCYTCDYEGDSIVGILGATSSKTADFPVLKLGSVDNEDNSLLAKNSDPLDSYDWPTPQTSAANSAWRASRPQGAPSQTYIPATAPANPPPIATQQSEWSTDVDAEISSPGTQELMRVSIR